MHFVSISQTYLRTHVVKVCALWLWWLSCDCNLLKVWNEADELEYGRSELLLWSGHNINRIMSITWWWRVLQFICLSVAWIMISIITVTCILFLRYVVCFLTFEIGKPFWVRIVCIGCMSFMTPSLDGHHIGGALLITWEHIKLSDTCWQ